MIILTRSHAALFQTLALHLFYHRLHFFHMIFFTAINLPDFHAWWAANNSVMSCQCWKLLWVSNLTILGQWHCVKNGGCPMNGLGIVLKYVLDGHQTEDGRHYSCQAYYLCCLCPSQAMLEKQPLTFWKPSCNLQRWSSPKSSIRLALWKNCLALTRILITNKPLNTHGKKNSPEIPSDNSVQGVVCKLMPIIHITITNLTPHTWLPHRQIPHSATTGVRSGNML